MKLETITVRNTMGVRDVALTLDTPITIISGGNYSGKSSLLESVRFALGDDPVRVSLKKEYGALVTEGAKNGRIAVTADGAEYGLTLPAGKRYGPEGESPFLSYVLDARRFAALNEDGRRKLLFALTASKVSAADVRERLLRRKIDEKLVDQAVGMLGRGFPAAEEWARDQAKQAKADWKATTGETWGAQKGEDWTAPDVPAHDAVRLRHVATLLDEYAGKSRACQRDLGVLTERANAHAAWEQRLQNVGAGAERLAELRRKLEFDQAELAKWQQQVDDLQARAGSEPREGLIHDLARALHETLETLVEDDPYYESARAALATYENQYGSLNEGVDPEAAAALPAAIRSRDLMQRSVENDQRDITQAQASADAGPEPEKASQEDLRKMQEQAAEVDREVAALTEERQRLDRAALAEQAARDSTTKATAYHAKVVAYLELAEALSPDGIPGEILATALAPVNDRLRVSAQETGWMQPAIGADMSITANGRLYRLLSESEQWRVDSMLAEMISHLSGLRILVLDRADLLEPNARPELLYWLDGLATAGTVDTVLVGITLKSRPTGLPDTMRAYWLTQGRVESPQMAEAA